MTTSTASQKDRVLLAVIGDEVSPNVVVTVLRSYGEKADRPCLSPPPVGYDYGFALGWDRECR